ncbi:DUF2169 domain-containing protein [uncultured Pseudacidovorax sp.]|uniref:DUF2169 family type VI secretion system accessory protein n=1 Tax=uncultured Pseudacidovorax sp. TaxID=679313 RepID=UPI0025E292C4|nr:DUF2169 domain-containing protein [uncultured Pseudacidovorax sp.]
MQVHKPSALSLMQRSFEFRGRSGCAVSALMAVRMGHPDGLHEQTLWKLVQAHIEGGLVDEGMAKLTPEFLVSGRVHAPAHVPGVAASVTLGGVSKQVLAFAPRFWVDNTVRTGGAFEPVPLDWAQAYGGADFPANPAGVGRMPVDGVHWLPRLELPHSRVGTPTDAAVPAGFGALGPMHPQRAALRGTYDEQYLRQHAPGFAPDLDWSHFNMAPRDQWLPGPLRGDEPYLLENLHPAGTVLQGTLPRLRARVFAQHAAGAHGEATLREVPMRLTTVWFLPEVERLVLVWHGLLQVEEDDASDIAHLLGALERLDEGRADEHYAQVLERRLDPRFGGIESLDESVLLPADWAGVDADFDEAGAAFQMEGLHAEAQLRRASIDVGLARERAIEAGRDPDALGLKMPQREAAPTPSELPAYLKAKQAQAEKEHWAVVDELATQLEKIMDSEDLLGVRTADLIQRGPPDYSAERHLAQLQAQGAALPLAPAALLSKLRLQEDAQRVAYWQSAHLQAPALPLTGDAGRQRRLEIEQIIALGLRTLPWIDLTGVDLSELDLRGFDFTAAWLESVSLRGANVSGCRFVGAVLAHADLRGCIAVGADFTAANLGGAVLAGAVFDQSNLEGATLVRSQLAQSSLRHAKLTGATLHDSIWGAADWTGCAFPGGTFHKLDLRALVLAQADLQGATFIECDLRGVDLSGAQLAGANFITCDLREARMNGARARGMVCTLGTVLDGMQAAQADLSEANWGQCSAVGLIAPGARFAGACLHRTDLRRADLSRANVQAALMTRARLSHAVLHGLDARDAVLTRASLLAADLRQANLFGADLSRVALSGDTRLDGALLERCRTWPRLDAQQQAVAAQREALA